MEDLSSFNVLLMPESHIVNRKTTTFQSHFLDSPPFLAYKTMCSSNEAPLFSQSQHIFLQTPSDFSYTSSMLSSADDAPLTPEQLGATTSVMDPLPPHNGESTAIDMIGQEDPFVFDHPEVHKHQNKKNKKDHILQNLNSSARQYADADFCHSPMQMDVLEALQEAIEEALVDSNSIVDRYTSIPNGQQYYEMDHDNTEYPPASASTVDVFDEYSSSDDTDYFSNRFNGQDPRMANVPPAVAAMYQMHWNHQPTLRQPVTKSRHMRRASVPDFGFHDDDDEEDLAVPPMHFEKRTLNRNSTRSCPSLLTKLIQDKLPQRRLAARSSCPSFGRNRLTSIDDRTLTSFDRLAEQEESRKLVEAFPQMRSTGATAKPTHKRADSGVDVASVFEPFVGRRKDLTHDRRGSYASISTTATATATGTISTVEEQSRTACYDDSDDEIQLNHNSYHQHSDNDASTSWSVKPTVNRKHWKPDQAASSCKFCYKSFSLTRRRHHCRICGDIFCNTCTAGRARLNSLGKPVAGAKGSDGQYGRVCCNCHHSLKLKEHDWVEGTQRFWGGMWRWVLGVFTEA